VGEVTDSHKVTCRTLFIQDIQGKAYISQLLADTWFWFLTSRNRYFRSKYFVCFKNL